MTAETINLDELLALIGYSTDTTRGCMEYVSLCQQAEGTPFTGKAGVWFDAPTKAANLTQKAGLNLWFGVNALRSVAAGRGKADDVTRLAALIADLDIKPGGCPDLETAFAIITAVSKVLGEEPVVVTHSGHGLHPFWPVEVESGRALLTESNDQAKRLGKRFHALLDKTAADHGCGVDSTFDLPRVLRVPGSVNYKDPENPVPVRCFATGGKPLTVEQITAALDAAGIPEEPKTRGSSKKQQPRAEKSKPKDDTPPLYAVSAAMTSGHPSPKVSARLGGAMVDLAGTDRHKHMLGDVLGLLRYGRNGEPGVATALEMLYRAFIDIVGPDRMGGEDEAAGEFVNFVTGAEELLDAEPPREQDGEPNWRFANDQPEGDTREPKPRKTARSVTWRTAADIRDRRPEWGWIHNGGGRLPRSALSLFAARPGVGKSTAARWFAAGYTRGTVEGCFYRHPQNVAYIATEESLEAMVKPSLRAVEADMTRIHFPKVEMDGKQVRLLSVLDEATLTADFIERGISVVIVDPVMSTVGGKVDLNRNNEIRDCLEPWARMAEAIDGMVLAIVHLIKVPGGDILAAINGSSAFGEVARAVIAFALDLQAADGSGVLSQEKNNAGRNDLALEYAIESVRVQTDDLLSAEVARFVPGGQSDRRVADVLRVNTAGQRLGARSWEVVEVVRGADGPVGADIVSAAVTGLTRNDATQYLRRLERAGFLVRVSRGLYEYRRSLADRLREGV